MANKVHRDKDSRSYTTVYENQSSSDLTCSTRHRGYPGKGIIEGDCAHNLKIGIIRALNENAGRLFRAATQHRQNNSDNQGKKEGKDQESIQSSTSSDPGYQWEIDNYTIRHHKREPRGQPFPSR